MTHLIELNPNDQKIVMHLLEKYIPHREVKVFGSRAKWTAKNSSDLDLCIMGNEPLPKETLVALSEAFEVCELPIKVDIVEWCTLDNRFQEIIERDGIDFKEKKINAPSGAIRKCKLEDLITYISRGITPSYTQTTTHSCMVLNQKCIRNSTIDYALCRRNDLEIKKVHPDKFLKRNDVTINSTGVGTLGRVAQFCEFSDESVTVDSHITIVRPDKDKIDPLFFGYLLKSKQKTIESLGVGTTGQTELSRHAIKYMPVEFIDNFATQKVIGKMLLNLDKKIAVNSQVNNTLESIAQALFKSWFVDFDPVHAKVKAIKEGHDPELAAMATIAGKTEAEIKKLKEKDSKLADTSLQLDNLRHIASLFPKEFVKSEIGSIPKGWNTIAIYELGSYINGAAYKAFSPNEEQRGLPIIKIAELKSGITAQTRYSAVEMSEKYKIEAGDILFSWSGNPETSIDTFIWTHTPAWLNQHIFKVIPKNTEERSFLLLSLKCLKPIFNEIARNKQTTGLGHVTVSDLKGLRLTKPENLILKKWDELISPIIKSVLNRELEKQTLIGLRDTILPKLISGQIPIDRLDTN